MDKSPIHSTKNDLSGLNEPQKEAVVSEYRRLLVLAGAGSGKINSETGYYLC